MDGFKVVTGFIFLSVFMITSYGGLFQTVSTDMGTIIGKLERTYFKNKTYQYVSYLGIPYAEESFDYWRFRKPRVPKRFDKPYNATYIRPSCLQVGYGRTSQKTSENCLFLNIYAPAESTINPVKTFPVLIYFHGGDFKVGSANDVSPEVLSSYGDVVVVTINYRLGIFGFLSTGDKVARGNFALWDQHFAIKWVRYNIASFGGDVDNITLLGQTAGAASALYQGLYPGNRGLFHRIIAINGNSLSPWAINPPNAKIIGRKLDCIKYIENLEVDIAATVDCIKDQPNHILLKVGVQFDDIGPTVDGEFLTDHPAKLLTPMMHNVSDAYKFFRSLDVVIGFNENNGDVLLRDMLVSRFNQTGLEDVEVKRSQFEYIFIRKLLQPLYEAHKAIFNADVSFISARHVEEVVAFQYTNWTDPDSSEILKRNLQQISRELNFFVPCLNMADSHSTTNTNASTYLFQFNYRPTFDARYSPWFSRLGIGLETVFLFGLPNQMTQELRLNRKDVTEWDLQLAENMMKWISNFAKTGYDLSRNL